MSRLGKKAITASLLLGFLVLFSGNSCGQEIEEPIAKRFNGEVLRYEIGFWFFFPVGGGVADFRSLGQGRYLVYHEGQAYGFIGWLTRHRKEIYRSVMRTINEGTRLIPIRYEENTVRGDWYLKKTTHYDYSAKKVIVETDKKGDKKREEFEIPAGTLYDDPVTAFYNFRSGVYGPVEPGKEFILRTLPTKGEEIIRLQVASKEEADTRRAAEEDKREKDFFVRIILNREMWGRKKGELEIWFNRELLPTSGIVKDLPLLGDVRGKRTYRGFISSPGIYNSAAEK